MRILSLLTAAAAVAAVFSSPSAQATIRLADDPGGLIAAYQHRFDRARANHERIIIDGSCLSACTLAVGLVPRDQVCATPNAVLGFHAAWEPTPYGGRQISRSATMHMLEIYPPELKTWIAAHGGLKPQMMYLKGTELTALVPACTDADIAAAHGLRPLTIAGARPSGPPRPRMVVARRHPYPVYYGRPRMVYFRPY